jgi:hypothetical protein
MSTNDDTSAPNLRTPLALVIRTLTTHCFALGAYAYTSNLLRRPANNHIQVLRLIFFLFVPTLPLVEILTNAMRSLFHYVRNYEDEDTVHFRFYISAALGMHASLSQDDENKEDAKDRSKNLHLLATGSHCAENTVIPFDWVWIGKLLAALFNLTQAVGTIVMWARRLDCNEADALGFDHRNGAMGIASTICGSISILALIIRLNWKVSKSFEAPQGQEKLAWSASTVFVCEMLASMLLHLGIASAANIDNRWMYSSVGTFAFLLSGNGQLLLQGWQSIILLVFVYVFRKDISRRLGLAERFQNYFGAKQAYRAKALIRLLLVLWIATDLVRLFVLNILEVVNEAKVSRAYKGTYPGVWWQDPLSDTLLVI